MQRVKGWIVEVTKCYQIVFEEQIHSSVVF
jgi:hypothetical protein